MSPNMPPDPLFALSPLDGRYARETEPLRDYFSEFALMRDRVGVEIAYLRELSQQTSLVRPLSPIEDRFLLDLLERFASNDARRIKELEEETRHDVKAVEYYLREQLSRTTLNDLIRYLHFGLTSEDVNQTALASALLESRDAVLLPALDELLGRLRELAAAYKATPMLARTHGQPAVPTTLGKEFANYWFRIKAKAALIRNHQFTAKLTGAVGNFNAQIAAAPQVDWVSFSARLIRSLGLEPHFATTQLMPYDNWIQYFDHLKLTNSILLDLAQDMWQYTSAEYIRLKTIEGHVGSSTMPQKVNPIDFENAEGNLGIANALFTFYAQKLPISRLQRDLSDSTVRRTLGVAVGHTLLAWQSLKRGLDQIEANEDKLRADLDAHWEIIAEGAQTILRAAGVADAYEQLKDLTRGRGLDREQYRAWVEELKIKDSVKTQLRALSPSTYLGLAPELVERLLEEGSSF